MIGRVNTGGGTGGTLTVTAPANVTVTVSKDGKTKTKNSGTSGVVVFKGLATGTWTLTITDGIQTASKPVMVTADYSTTIAFFSATINVTYPAGSTCTATDGETTLTAPDTSGTWDCVVPNAGTWTVTETTNNRSATVEITSDGQKENINLTRFYLFKSGDGEIVTMYQASEGNATITVGEDQVRFQRKDQSTAINSQVCYRNASPISVDDYSTACFEISCEMLGDSGYGGILCVANTAFTTNQFNVSPKYQLTVNANRHIVNLDISNLTGGRYIGTTGGWQGNLYNIWLE